VDPIGGATDIHDGERGEPFQLREIVADSSRGDWQLVSRV
jgi:hypothetical protein